MVVVKWRIWVFAIGTLDPYGTTATREWLLIRSVLTSSMYAYGSPTPHTFLCESSVQLSRAIRETSQSGWLGPSQNTACLQDSNVGRSRKYKELFRVRFPATSEISVLLRDCPIINWQHVWTFFLQACRLVSTMNEQWLICTSSQHWSVLQLFSTTIQYCTCRPWGPERTIVPPSLVRESLGSTLPLAPDVTNRTFIASRLWCWANVCLFSPGTKVSVSTMNWLMLEDYFKE